MGKYKIKDFAIGDTVYHLSNTDIKMVVIQINEELNEVSCRWIDKAGNKIVDEFLAQELGKSSDLRPKINFGNIQR